MLEQHQKKQTNKQTKCVSETIAVVVHVVQSSQNSFSVIYQTRETVFHRDIQTPRRELKTKHAAEYFFFEIRGVWIADETLSQVFYISSQSHQKPEE